ncbi:hypothetical protein C0989_001149 [Termitomyces sp. Mn162]|nr:hypothetical protein C0989_001149 [Termitomyces sp. Mn162]
MSQLANPDTPSEAPALQNKAWTCLLHLETQVQLTQSSLTHHTTELSTLHQTTDLISQSLQVLLKCLPPNSAPPAAMELAPTASALISAALVTLRPQIPHPMLQDAYNGTCSSGEQFLQSCLTYIHLSRDAFDSDVLKIAWVLSYMKTRHAFTYMLTLPATRDLHGCGCHQAALHCPATVLEMLEAQALCMTLSLGSGAEQEELLLQLLAVKDAARAPLLDEPTPELTLEEISTCTSLLELEEDF